MSELVAQRFCTTTASRISRQQRWRHRQMEPRKNEEESFLSRKIKFERAVLFKNLQVNYLQKD